MMYCNGIEGKSGMEKGNRLKLGLIISTATMVMALGSFERSQAQFQSDHEESILKLMEDIFNQFSDDMLEIDPDIGR
ncbi:hypothetical protein MJD09_01085, partial [bacterium]|nr:hypothetical protein [bacterium]